MLRKLFPNNEQKHIKIFSIGILFIGIFGVWGLGWLDTAMPQLVWVTLSFIFVSFVIKDSYQVFVS